MKSSASGKSETFSRHQAGAGPSIRARGVQCERLGPPRNAGHPASLCVHGVKVTRHPHSRSSEADGNFVAVVGNVQVDSAFAIGDEGGVQVEHVERDGALPAINADRQNARGEQEAAGFEALSVGQDEYGWGQLFGGGIGCVRYFDDLRLGDRRFRGAWNNNWRRAVADHFRFGHLVSKRIVVGKKISAEAVAAKTAGKESTVVEPIGEGALVAET